MTYDKLNSTVSLAGVPELNLYQECGTFKSSQSLSTSEEVAAVLSKYFTDDSEELGDGKSTTNVYLDEDCCITGEGALGILNIVASHSPAYGKMLVNSEEKAIETFKSMQPELDPQQEGDADMKDKCTWYGSVDNDKLSRICLYGFPIGDQDYWRDWIGFILICIHPDQRTVTYVVGADSD
jgi:hypothetical protein